MAKVYDSNGNLLYETGKADFTGGNMTRVKIETEGVVTEVEVSTTQSGLTPIGRKRENFLNVITFKVEQMVGVGAQVLEILENLPYLGHDPNNRRRK